jgi:D-alanyl-D-alanine carboxypeptidase (penicillin-binding protein 5/6)
MTTTPFMTPGQSGGRRDFERRRRRRRAAGIIAAALAILAAVFLLTRSTTHGHRGAAAAHASHTPRPAPITPPRTSPAGEVLGTPAFTLAGAGEPQLDAVHVAFRSPPRAGLLFNLGSGQVLWQRNAWRRLRIASLTKMMTALITVRSAPPGAHVLVTRQDVDQAGSKVGVLPVGRHVRLESMLYGLLLPSGNDAADALAQHVSGSLSRFVARMNTEAAKLGLACSRFSSPSGYIDAGNFSCPVDLAVLAHLDLEQPRLSRIVRTASATLPFPIKGGKLYLYNNNPLLIYRYPGLTGLKTGYTLASGKCLVATAERHGVRLGVVLLDSPDPATQAMRLLNRGFQGVYHQAQVPQPPIPAGA